MKPEGVTDFYPLSPLQEGLLYHSLASPDSGVYFNQCQFALRGDLDVEAFGHCWEQVTQRHDILRSCFVWEGLKTPVQVVNRRVQLPIQQYDWRGLDAAAQHVALEELLDEMRRRGFQLNQAPLMRLDLVRTGEDRHEFIWSFHHLLLDGWSMYLVLQDAFGAYEAALAGRAWTLRPPRPYRDFIAHVKRQDLAAAEHYWKGALRGFGTPTPLPLDHGAPGDSLSAGETMAEELRLGEAATEALQSLARRCHVTLNTVIQLAWGLLLSRYGDTPDVVFGSVISGRPPELEGFEQMVGLFINTLPVRVTLAPDDTFEHAVKKLQQQQIEARQYEFSPLMQVRRWSEVPGDQPLFDSLLVFENYRKEMSIEEMVKSVRIENIRWLERVNFPLTLIAIPETMFVFRMLYDNARFKRQTVSRMLQHLQNLLEAMLANPEARLDDLPLLSDSERRQLMVEWNQTTTDYPRESSIPRLFEEMVERDPNAVALSLGQESLTYGALNERANQVAHHLLTLGVGPDASVGIGCERSLEMIIGLLGILKAGGAYLPLDLAYPKARIQLMLEEAQSPVVLTQRRFLDAMPETAAHIVCLDRDAEQIGAHSTNNPNQPVEPDHLAYVMFTSGSTGRPKGTLIPHRAVVRLVRDTNYAEFGPSQTFLQFSTLSFDASTLEIWGPLLNGGRLAIFPPQQASLDDLGQVIRDAGVTTLWLTAGLFHEMMDRNPSSLRGVKQLLAGGDVLSVAHVRRALQELDGCTVINGYGPTENTTFTCCYPMKFPSQIEGTVPIGRPISNTRVYLLDRLMRPVPIGAPGELYIGGDGLARSYLNQPELTREKFVPCPFDDQPDRRLYRTGDRCRYLPDGRIEFLGRRDNQVKIRGFRIELGEIELALHEHPDVRQAAVLALDDPAGDKRLVAYVVSRTPAGPSLADVREFLRQRIPAYMLPQALVTLDEFPLTLSGKIDRRLLPAPAATRDEAAGAFAAPQTELERQIAAVWQTVLQLDQVGLDDNFFDLGGHSLQVMRVYSQLCSALGRKFSIVHLFQFPTIRGLASFLSDGQQDELPLEDVQERARRQREARQRQRQHARRSSTSNE